MKSPHIPAARSSAALLAAAALLAGACSSGGPVTPSPSGSGHGSGGGRTTVILKLSPAGFKMPAPVQREVAVADGATAFLAGGLDSTDTSTSDAIAIDSGTGKVTQLGRVPQAFHDAAGALIGGQLFVFGGGTAESSDVVQSFDPNTGKGRVAGHLPKALSDIASAAVGGTVYLVGGYDGHTAQATIYSTTDGTRFKAAGALPVGLRYAAVAVAGTRLVVAGGVDDKGQPVDSIYAFDTKTGKTSPLGTLPAPVGHAAAVALAGQVYVIGGLDASGNAVDSVTAVDPASGRDTKLSPLRRPVSDAATAAVPTGALLFGGWRGGAVDDVLQATLKTVRTHAHPKPSASTVTGPSAAPSSTALTGAAAAAAKQRPFGGLLLIADRGNDRLLVMGKDKKIIWRYPSPSLPKPTNPFFFADDAFWVHGGHAILVNEEENDTLAEIAYPSGKTIWTYGHPKVPGAGPGYTNWPDDLYPYPGGGMVVADSKNCRILFFDAKGNPTRQIGENGNCTHNLPKDVGYPNGSTPLPNGNLLVSELHSGRVDEITSQGKIVWSVRLPQLRTPSDPQPMPDGNGYMTVNYEHPGAIVQFDSKGKILWYYHPTSGPNVLDHPSLAAPMPNGLVAINDDFNNRVQIIDPKTDKVVWQYGTGVAGAGPGQLQEPDGLDLLFPGGFTPMHLDFATDRVRKGVP